MLRAGYLRHGNGVLMRNRGSILKKFRLDQEIGLGPIRISRKID
jgi:hypothetical protein